MPLHLLPECVCVRKRSAPYTSHMIRRTASLRLAFVPLPFAAQGAASRSHAPSRAGLQKTPAQS